MAARVEAQQIPPTDQKEEKSQEVTTAEGQQQEVDNAAEQAQPGQSFRIHFQVFSPLCYVCCSCFGGVVMLADFLYARTYANDVPAYLAWTRGAITNAFVNVPFLVALARNNCATLAGDSRMKPLYIAIGIAVFLAEQAVYSFPPYFGILIGGVLCFFFALFGAIFADKVNKLPSDKGDALGIFTVLLTPLCYLGVATAVWYPLVVKHVSGEVAGFLLTAWLTLLEVLYVKASTTQLKKHTTKWPELANVFCEQASVCCSLAVLYIEGFRFAALFVDAVYATEANAAFWSSNLCSFVPCLFLNIANRTGFTQRLLFSLTRKESHVPTCTTLLTRAVRYGCGYPRYALMCAIMLGRFMCGSASPWYFNEPVVYLLLLSMAFMVAEDLFLLVWTKQHPREQVDPAFAVHYQSLGPSTHPVSKPWGLDADGQFTSLFTLSSTINNFLIWITVTMHLQMTYNVITARVSFQYVLGLKSFPEENPFDGSVLWPVK